jgi:hypothetical protein
MFSFRNNIPDVLCDEIHSYLPKRHWFPDPPKGWWLMLDELRCLWRAWVRGNNPWDIVTRPSIGELAQRDWTPCTPRVRPNVHYWVITPENIRTASDRLKIDRLIDAGFIRLHPTQGVPYRRKPPPAVTPVYDEKAERLEHVRALRSVFRE